jgi:hypothetical protein
MFAASLKIYAMANNLLNLLNALPRVFTVEQMQQILEAQSAARANARLTHKHSGQTIRGMTHVSPLVEFKFHNRTVVEIAERYFPDANDYDINGHYMVIDPNCDCEKLMYSKTPNRFTYQPSGHFAFNVYIFTSTDAVKLAEAYECVRLSHNEVVFFIEDNTGDNISDLYASVKISDNLLEKNILKHGVEEDLKNNGYLYSYLKSIFKNLSHADISELMHKGYIENKSIARIASIIEVIVAWNPLNLLPEDWKRWLKNNVSIQALVSPSLAWLMEVVKGAKIEDYRWNPKALKYKENGNVDTDYNPEKDFKPFFTSWTEDFLDNMEDGEANKTIAAYAERMNQLLTDLDKKARERLGIDEKFETTNGRTEVNTIEEFMYQKFKQVIQTLHTFFEKLKTMDLSDIIKKGLRIFNAFLCGLWNSLVEMVAGFIFMIKMIFDAITMLGDIVNNIRTALPLLLESFDNIIQAIHKIDFHKIISKIKEKIIYLFTDGVVKLQWEQVGYFAGAFFGFIISLVIEIVAGIILSGGALSVVAVTQKLTEMLAGFLSIFTNAVSSMVKGVTKIVVGSIKALLNSLKAITEFLRQPPEAFLKLIDDIFDAFKKYGKEARTGLNSNVIPILGRAEIMLAGRIVKSFYKALKKPLLALLEEKKLLHEWKKLKAMRELPKKGLDELLEIKHTHVGMDGMSNVATMKVKVSIKGEIKELNYKAISGKKEIEGFCKSPDRADLKSKLQLTDDEFGSVYNAKTKESYFDRFNDTEHKIFTTFDEELAQLKGKYGEYSVKVMDMNFKSLLEPCNSCKRQIVGRAKIYNIKEVVVESVKISSTEFAIKTKQLNKIFNLKK